MAMRWVLLLVVICHLQIGTTGAVPLVSGADDTTSAAFTLASDTATTIAKRLGWGRDELKISKIDTVDAKIGEAVVYEFDIQVGDTRLPPLVFAEEIKNWNFILDDPFRGGEQEEEDSSEQLWGLEKQDADWKAAAPVLAPFELAGPVDLWISDGKQMRLALPHDVDAGVLNRVLLADGAVVRVQGAREVSLFRPVQLPLPLVGALGEGLSDLASRLRLTSQIGDKPIISLRIVGPSSLVAAAMEEADEGSSTAAARLKVKRLAPGAVELVSRQPAAAADPSVVLDSSSLSLRDSRLWPFSSVNSSSSKLVALEEALVQVLGQKAHQRGSLKLLEAKAMAASFVQFDFELERSLANASSGPEQQWPDWMTAPSVQRFQFQALAKVEGHRLVPVRVDQLEPVRSAVSFLPSVMTGNVSFTEMSTFLPPPGAMTLDFDWD